MEIAGIVNILSFGWTGEKRPFSGNEEIRKFPLAFKKPLSQKNKNFDNRCILWYKKLKIRKF